jgi:hypothetical protein
MTNVTPLFNSGRSPEEEESHLRQEAIDSLYRALTGAINGRRCIPTFLKECFEREAWKHERILVTGNRQNPISFHEFIYAPYPVGLETTYDELRSWITQDTELLALFDRASQRPVGANQHTEPVYIVHDQPVAKAPKRPTGNSVQAVIRRLRKASDEGDERAAHLLQEVTRDNVSANGAAIEMGWRKKPTPLQTAMQAWGKMSAEEKAQFREWAFGDVGEGAYAAEPVTAPEEDGELLRLGQQLEALLVLWAETHGLRKERAAAIAEAIEKATGMSEEEGRKKYGYDLSGLFGGQAKPMTPEERRCHDIVDAIRRKFNESDDAIRRKFNESDEYDPKSFWREPLEAIIDQVIAITPKTLAGLGVQARAVQYFLWNSDWEWVKQAGRDNIRSLVAAIMTLAGLPEPGVPSDTIDADAIAFAKSFSVGMAER